MSLPYDTHNWNRNVPAGESKVNNFRMTLKL